MLKSEDVIFNTDRGSLRYGWLSRSRSGSQIGRRVRLCRSQQVGTVVHSSTTAGYTNGMGRTRLLFGSA